MKILHNNQTSKHNPDSESEGAYRVKNFQETVSTTELAKWSDAENQFILQTHTPRYLNKIRGACRSKNELAETKLSPESYDAITTSVALSIMAAETCGFAITRPPGHHASKEKAEGFCLINNIAVATNYLLGRGKRICIIDIDGHHGNGTQAIFKHEERAFFASIHQDGAYPYSGLSEDVGEGKSLKKVVNIPIPRDSGDDVFLASLDYILTRVRKFDPDIIGVSAGFDGYADDKILQLKYSLRGYYEAGVSISSLGKPIFAVLEGGYHDDIKACVNSFVSGVSGEAYVYNQSLTASPVENMSAVRLTLKKVDSLLL